MKRRRILQPLESMQGFACVCAYTGINGKVRMYARARTGINGRVCIFV